MTRTLQIDGEEVKYPDDTQISELKQKLGWEDEHIVTYNDDGDWTAISDDKTVGDIPESAPVTPAPDKTEMFGRSGR
jgi:hypothetical protein